MNYFMQVKVMEQKQDTPQTISQPQNNAVNQPQQNMPQNPPLYDSDTGKSTDTDNNINDLPNANNMVLSEAELVKALYTRLNATLYPFVIKVLDEYDYNTSPIYDKDGISRETLSQLVSMVLDMAAEQLDDIDEIRLEVSARQIPVGGWNRSTLLNAAVEALILNNIFMYRRPRRQRIYNSYSFKNGKYNGLNYG